MLVKPADEVLETAASVEPTAVAGVVSTAVDDAAASPGEKEGNSDKPLVEAATNDDPSGDFDQQRPTSPQMKAPHISTLYDKQVGRVSPKCCHLILTSDGRGLLVKA